MDVQKIIKVNLVNNMAKKPRPKSVFKAQRNIDKAMVSFKIGRISENQKDFFVRNELYALYEAGRQDEKVSHAQTASQAGKMK